MRRLRPLAALVAGACVSACLAAVPAVARAQSRAELSRVIRRLVMSNGLEVVVVENHGVPLATVEIDVKNGSYTQTPDYAGLAHMYEHMFFKASRDYPAPDEFTQRLGELGAVFNATTQEEDVSYYMTLPADSARVAMEAMASAVRSPLFREDELAREKEVVLGEYDRNQSGPGFDFQQEMTRRLYPGSFSRKNVIGDREVLRTVTPAKMREIQKRYYVPNNAALVVTGDVRPDSVFAWAARFYGAWERQPNPFQANPIPPIAPLTTDQGVIAAAPVSATTVFVQWQGPSVRRDRASTYAADVLSDALNTDGSRFQHRLVDSGLWQGIAVNYYTLDQKGPITISGQPAPGRAREALEALFDEVEHVADPGYFTADELQAVKAQRTMNSALGAEKTSSLTHTVGFWWAVADIEYFMGYGDTMARQTPEDLRRYAAAYIVGQPRVTGVLLPSGERSKFPFRESDLAVFWRQVLASRPAPKPATPTTPVRAAASRKGDLR